jgi:zinc transport system substrate-binding protein
MKKLLLLFILPFLLPAGCRNAGKQLGSGGLDDESSAKPVVYASNYPLYYFATRIGGDHIEVHFPAAGLADPSLWTPPADTVAAMQRAELILLNGATFEGWLMNVSLPDSLLTDTSEAFADLLLPGGETFTHSHGEEGEHAHEGTAFTTWLDLSLAARQASAIRDALIRIQPARKDIYEKNFKTLANELEELDRAFMDVAVAAAGKKLVFSHPVYQYFQQAYHLDGNSLHWEPDTPLDSDMLHQVGHLKKDGDIQYMVWESTPLPESVDKLAALGIRSAVIAPMGGTPESGDFLQGLEKNLTSFREALGQQP